MATAEQHAGERHAKRYVVDVDGAEVEFDHEPVTGAEIMAAAGIPQEVGLLQILEDGTQKPVKPTDEFELKPGRRFKKRPRFKRGEALLDRRQKELELVEAQFGELERAVDLSWFVVRRLRVPAGWSLNETPVLIMLPPGYPETPPDNFYTDPGLTIANGQVPNDAGGMLDHEGRRWRRFSWHFEDTGEWGPDAEIERGHNLLTFLLGVQQRLAEPN